MGRFLLGGIQFAEPLVEALKLVGPKLSTEACIEKLNTFKNWKGLGGAITWNKNRHQGTDSNRSTSAVRGANRSFCRTGRPMNSLLEKIEAIFLILTGTVASQRKGPAWLPVADSGHLPLKEHHRIPSHRIPS